MILPLSNFYGKANYCFHYVTSNECEKSFNSDFLNIKGKSLKNGLIRAQNIFSTMQPLASLQTQNSPQ
jgi:hypothetical protein